MTRTMKALTVLVAASAAAFAAVTYVAISREGPAQTSPLTAAGLRGNVLPADLTSERAPRIRLADAERETVDTRELAGRPYAVTFLYTQCPDVCPAIGQEVRLALEELGPDASDITVLAVSVDPRGDTPEAVREWLDLQRLPDNFRYLVGSERELKPVWDAYHAAPQIPGRPETSTHTASLWLVGADGRLRTKYSAGAPIPPEDLAHDLRVLLEDAPDGAGVERE